ncbi:MAG: type II toxin-antitoxin system RelE/ParE family toxin [Bdellovibrionales bacterium]|nr:type II toxin-antitoxin system RelE/ParE family toxin [Bdellovibrionales bacterium]
MTHIDIQRQELYHTIQVKDRVYVLHCFKKKSSKTAGIDLELAKNRLKQVR